MITPNGLHFERSHSGTPDIDPDQHRLVIHGLVKRPLVFTLEALSRYPMESRIAFIECAGNSARSMRRRRSRSTCRRSTAWSRARNGPACGSRRCSMKPASIRRAKWMLAEGADAAAHEPQRAAGQGMDDALVCLYQNGERVRPANGYPMRLLLPGFEGNMNVKWLRRLKLDDAPIMTKDETSKYTILLQGRKSAGSSCSRWR